MPGMHGPWWLPPSDSPSDISEEELQETEAGLRTATVVIGAFLVVCLLVGLAARAWAIEDDLASRRQSETLATLEGR